MPGTCRHWPCTFTRLNWGTQSFANRKIAAGGRLAKAPKTASRKLATKLATLLVTDSQHRLSRTFQLPTSCQAFQAMGDFDIQRQQETITRLRLPEAQCKAARAAKVAQMVARADVDARSSDLGRAVGTSHSLPRARYERSRVPKNEGRAVELTARFKLPEHACSRMWQRDSEP